MIQTHWNSYPLLRAFLWLGAGVFFGDLIPLAPELAYPPLFLGLVMFKGIEWLPTLSYRQISFLRGCGMGLFFISLGLLLSHFHTDTNKPDHIFHLKGEIRHWYGRVISYPELRERHERAIVEIQGVKTEGVWMHASGLIQVYFPLDTSGGTKVQYGSSYLFEASPGPLKKPQNPEEFDYADFLARQNIFHQYFANEGKYLPTGEGKVNILLEIAYELRAFYSARLTKYIEHPQSLSIAQALLLGIKDGLDHDLKDAFSAAGAMHILAVSGLHVGIIFLVLRRLLQRLRTAKEIKKRLAFLGISLCVLWMYTLVAGASASVVRATTMFSFMVLSQTIHRQSSIYNTLALAGILMLLFNSKLLFTVGFQLSFLAVFGIVYLQPFFVGMFSTGNKVIRYFWELSAVSLAAQLATFPLGLLYFNRFPVYFLLANLFVIPGAFGVMALGVLFFILSPFEPMAKIIGLGLDHLIRLMNTVVYTIEKLPQSTLDGLWMAPAQTVLLYLLLFSILTGIINRKWQWLQTSFALSILWAAFSCIMFLERAMADQLVFYQVAGSSYIDRLKAGFFTPRFSAGQDEQKAIYHTQGNRVRYAPFGKRESESASNELMIWDEKTFLFLENDSLPLPLTFETDYLILGKNRVTSLSQLPEQLKFHTLVIDGNNSRRTADKLVEEAKTAGIPHHSIIHHGALILKKNVDKD